MCLRFVQEPSSWNLAAMLIVFYYKLRRIHIYIYNMSDMQKSDIYRFMLKVGTLFPWSSRLRIFGEPWAHRSHHT